MRTFWFSLFSLALVLSPSGCDTAKKDGNKDKQGSAVSIDSNAINASDIKSPQAGDLAGYVKDLSGSGKLMARIKTSMGEFNCELYEKRTPVTIANFVGLARGLKPWKHPRTRKLHKKPYYDGIIFHRVIPGFMVQVGDPLGVGSGGPGYKFKDEFHPDLRHDKGGILSMANSGPRTNGSQFFITEKPTPHLNDRHTVFGHCNEIDLVKRIARVPAAGRNRPLKDVTITGIEFYRGG